MKIGRPRYDAVCFDFDSTLSRLEGIDELARRCGAEVQVARLTAAAMDGSLPLEAVYGTRLDLVRPGREDVAWLGEHYLREMVPGVEATFEALRLAGVAVYIVSGGIRDAILPFAEICGLPQENVHAVEIWFNADGSYEGFDRTSPLTRADGKAIVCGTLARRHPALALIGDGVTDLAARRSGACVIGFGGVVAREAVRSGADHYATGPSLTDVLDYLLARD